MISSDPFFIWAEPLLIDDSVLRHYYFAGCQPQVNDLDNLLTCYRLLYDLQKEAGLLDGEQIDCEE
jgi:hypothetical protein